HPNDNGKAIDLKWQLSPDDTPEKKPRVVRGYIIYRTIAEAGKDKRVEIAAPREGVRVAFGVGEYTDSNCVPGIPYQYEVVAVGAGGKEWQPARPGERGRGVVPS